MKNRYIINDIPRQGASLRKIIKEICLVRRLMKGPKKVGFIQISSELKEKFISKSLILKIMPQLSLVTWCGIEHQEDNFFPINHPNQILMELVIKDSVIRFGIN